MGERRDVLERDRLGVTVADGDRGDDETGRRVEADLGDRLGDRHHAGLDEHGGDADRPVAAHRQAAAHLDEEHAPVGVGSRRRLQDRPTHRAVAAGLVHQQRPEIVELRHQRVPPFGHRVAGG